MAFIEDREKCHLQKLRSLFQDSQAAGFVQENAKKVMNDLNATTKKRIATQIDKYNQRV